MLVIITYPAVLSSWAHNYSKPARRLMLTLQACSCASKFPDPVGPWIKKHACSLLSTHGIFVTEATPEHEASCPGPGPSDEYPGKSEWAYTKIHTNKYMNFNTQTDRHTICTPACM